MFKQSKGFLWGAIAGGVIGSVTALLLTPKTGKEMRSDISAGAQRVSEVTVKTVNEACETTGRFAKQIGEQAVDFADKAKQVGIGVKDTMKSWRTSTDEETWAEVSSTHESRQKDLEQAFSDSEDGIDAGSIRS